VDGGDSGEPDDVHRELATMPTTPAAGGTATPADFVASATDKQGGPAIANHGYRGGPFVIDAANVAAATPFVNAWQTANRRRRSTSRRPRSPATSGAS